LWLPNATLDRPRSLGRIDNRPIGPTGVGDDAQIMAGATFAMSLEPADGSPDDMPTGQFL
jgi:anti-sigma-K factor RskA